MSQYVVSIVYADGLAPLGARLFVGTVTTKYDLKGPYPVPANHRVLCENAPPGWWLLAWIIPNWQ